jgi:tRNA (guanine-N7-)-methyltransferase
VSKGKLEKFEEMKGFEHVVQAPYHTIKQEDFKFKSRWATDFFGNRNPIILELGCGKGEYTVELAAKNPQFNYIGVDIKGARLWKGAKQAKQHQLKNVAFLRTNIEIITQFFAPNEVKEIWLTFPDPQMKKTRKRLSSTTFLNKYRNFLQEGGIIHLKTDSNFQYTYTREMALLNAFEILADTDNLYEWEGLNDTLRIKTFYEKQWLDRDLSIKYLAFRPHQAKYLEPDIAIEKDAYRSFGRFAKDL